MLSPLQVSANDPEILAETLANVTKSTTDIQAVDIRIATGLLEKLTNDAINEENTEVCIGSVTVT